MNAYFDGPLGRYDLAVDPNSVTYGYNLRTAETETYGGKVVQILGAEAVSPVVVSAEAGSGGWDELYRVAYFIRGYMGAAEKRHVHFVFPQKGWDMEGWFLGFPRFFVDLETLSPSYQVPFHVEWENGQLAESAISAELQKIQDGIGFDPDNKYRYPSGTVGDAADRAYGTWEKVVKDSAATWSQFSDIYFGQFNKVDQSNVSAANRSALDQLGSQYDVQVPTTQASDYGDSQDSGAGDSGGSWYDKIFKGVEGIAGG